MKNTLKTTLLLGILSVFLILIGSLIAGKSGLYFAFFISLAMNGIAYFFSDKIALASSGARLIKKNEVPEIWAIAKNLAGKMKIPVPKLYLISQSQANAFATGRDPKHASVAVTEGLIRFLDKRETEGVIAHELAHVKNRDILIASVAAVLASAITFLSRMGFYGGFGGRSKRRNSGALGLILAILAPFGAMLIQLAISRSREYAADQSAAKIMGSGKPLASALIKIDRSARQVPMKEVNPAFSSLYINNPFGEVSGVIIKLFSTHPPIAERVARLEAI